MKKLLFCLLLANTTLNANSQEMPKNYDVKQLLASLSDQQKTELMHNIQRILDNEPDEQKALLPSGQDIALTIVAIVVGGLMVSIPITAIIETFCKQDWLSSESTLCKIAKALMPAAGI
ncbi:hypothetical protein K2W90_00180 [Candidatus Babeliales bacterium]|nr:hypothetical protein [Candidatus Babeliales bacterium]